MADEQSNNDEDSGLSIFAKGIENIPAVLAAFEKYFGVAGSFKKVPIVAVGNPAPITTVFLGLDHSSNSEDPILWETMIFVKDGIDRHELDQSQWRYTNQLDAMVNHFAVVMGLQDLGYVMDMDMTKQAEFMNRTLDDDASKHNNPIVISDDPPIVKILGELERRGKRTRE